MRSEAELAELMGRMRLLEADHMPDDWPAVKMEDTTALCDAVVKANTERDRYRAALMQLWTNSTLNEHQSAIVREALGL